MTCGQEVHFALFLLSLPLQLQMEGPGSQSMPGGDHPGLPTSLHWDKNKTV
jgi:hypothetical protein